MFYHLLYSANRFTIVYKFLQCSGITLNNQYFFLFAGVALGSYVFIHLVNMSYTIMFTINATLLLLAIVYSLVWLKWQTSPRQQPLSGTNWLLNFFDMRHVNTTVRTLVKSRRNHGKLHLWLLLLAMCLYTFQRDEKPKSQMYTSLIFKWNVVDFSNFKTFQSTFYVLGQFDVDIISRN